MVDNDDDESWSSMRASIDGLLSRARAEWDSPGAGSEAVFVSATLDDVRIRIRTTAEGALRQARELAEAGWVVELRDASDRPLGGEGTSDDGSERPDMPALTESDMPPPALPNVDALRGTTWT